MTTKEYLNQIRDMRRRIAEKQAQINSMRSMLTSISVDTENERVSSSSDPDKIGTMIANILERESDLADYVKIFLKKEKEISEQIDNLSFGRCREILHWRYVECMTFESISANAMEITFRHAVRLHGQALKKFEEKYGELYLLRP